MLMRRRSRISSEIPTASMADIAFLLLIFFLVTTVFDEERGLAVVLPEGEETIEVPEANLLQFTVRADGQVQVRVGVSTAVELVAASRVGEIWQLEVARNPELIAAVRTSPDAPYRYMIDVLDELQRANAGRISLQIEETSQ
jgi:biopolymer transport protein ExbD